MRAEKNRSFLPMSLVPALLVVSAIAVLGTQEVRTQSVRATNWSDPATWPNKKVPAAGDKVIIGKDKDVVLDVSPPALGGLSIDGKLSFSSNADLEKPAPPPARRPSLSPTTSRVKTSWPAWVTAAS